LTGAASLDKLGQQSLGLGMDIGNTASAANARASQLRLGTAAPAAQAQFASSSWSPWASALGGLDKMGDQLMSAYMGKAPSVDTSTVGYTGPDRGLWF
jgi:hypothetical protein